MADRTGMQLSYEKKIQCLCQQMQEYSKQMDMIQGELDRTRNQLVTANRELDELKRLLGQREDALSCYESKLEDIKYELREREKNSQRLVENLQEKACKLHEQLQQRESALILCRNEVKSHLAAMDEVKASFQCELQQREMVIKQMKDDLQRIYDDLRQKSEENSQLERAVMDYKARVHQYCCQVKEAESRIACLQDKMQQMECQHAKEKQQCMHDMEEFEKKLNACCNDLCNSQNDLRRMNRCLAEKDEEIQNLNSERSCLARDLQIEKESTCAQMERALSLENDNKEICRLLQQKVKCIKELENALCEKQQELFQCQNCIDELNAKIRELHVGSVGEDNTDLESQLKDCRNKMAKLQAELEDTKHRLEWAVTEMENMAKEIKRLNCELENARKEIFEKNSMIGDLERTIEHTEQDMEARMRRVDEQLQKYEREIKDKTNMIGECEEKCCRYQHSLDEKEAELDQTEQRLKRASVEIQSLLSKAKELEETRDCFLRQLNEQKAQFTELCQEARLQKEQLDRVNEENTETKRDLGCCTRELDNYRREADELRMALQDKDCTLCRLQEEKNCLVGKVTNLQCRLESETTQLTQQMADMKYRLEKEVEQMRTCELELEETNAGLQQKVSIGQRQLAQLEKCYYQKVDALHRENQMMQTKLADKEDQLQATKDCVTLKESEIMRLKLRLCSMDQCNSHLDKPNDTAVPMQGANGCGGCNGAKAKRRSQSCGGPTSRCAEWKVTAATNRMKEQEKESEKREC
ncbi:hypothetical protein RRG08_052597 [Elysia crispata]|uniref:Uncharacterized protein n=1 Tax=Elysia crispata TaxID=231223 RepID=A0AAE1A194_9GAST|nr:hypothetical protein RRG08_052597 [Elysia crispata]